MSQLLEVVGRVPETDAERRRRWEAFRQATAERSIELGRAGLADEAMLLRMEIDGGNCRRCGVAWERVEVDNLYILGHRYRQACDCYAIAREGKEVLPNGKVRIRTAGELVAQPYWCSCDKCGKAVKLDRRRGVRNEWHVAHEGAPAVYERVICDGCANPRRRTRARVPESLGGDDDRDEVQGAGGERDAPEARQQEIF